MTFWHIVGNYFSCVTLLTLWPVAADPDFDSENENYHGYHSSWTSSNVWIAVGTSAFWLLCLLCMISGCLKYCKERANRRRGQKQSPEQKKVTLTPPAYISAEPPPYSAPDYGKLTHKELKAKQGNSGKKLDSGNSLQMLEVHTLPNTVPMSGVGGMVASQLYGIDNNQPPQYHGTETV